MYISITTNARNTRSSNIKMAELVMITRLGMIEERHLFFFFSFFFLTMVYLVLAT
jgi:hypothetical protein